MTAHSQQTTQVVNLVDSHVLLLSAVSDLFKWFEGAVAGNRAEDNIDTALALLDATIAADPFMNARLVNEWAAYARSLRSAYGNFGRDVVHRFGVDEPAQVRNLALNIAKSSLERIRTAAREHLVTQIEATCGKRA